MFVENPLCISNSFGHERNSSQQDRPGLWSRGVLILLMSAPEGREPEKVTGGAASRGEVVEWSPLS